MAESLTAAEAFRAKLDSALNSSAMVMGVAIGSQLGLFDIMANIGGPASSEEIARKGNYKERYIREWLGLVATSGVVNVDSTGKLFTLPADHMPALHGPANAGTFTFALPCLASVFTNIRNCFQQDGPEGVSYSAYPEFHEWRLRRMSESYTWSLLQPLVEAVPGLMKKLEEGVEVLDLGCSTGQVTIVLAQQFPNSKFCGIDIGDNAIAIANEAASSAGVTNASFLVQDVCTMPVEWKNRWQHMFAIDLIHDLAFPAKALQEIEHCLVPGGTMSVLDVNLNSNVADNIDQYHSPFIYFFSLFHCMPISLNTKGGAGLGAAWGREKATEMFNNAGFSRVEFVAVFGHTYHCLCSK